MQCTQQLSLATGCSQVLQSALSTVPTCGELSGILLAQHKLSLRKEDCIHSDQLVCDLQQETFLTYKHEWSGVFVYVSVNQVDFLFLATENASVFGSHLVKV